MILLAAAVMCALRNAHPIGALHLATLSIIMSFQEEYIINRSMKLSSYLYIYCTVSLYINYIIACYRGDSLKIINIAFGK